MFYIVGKNDTKNTFTVLDTEDMSREDVNKDDVLEYFKKTGVEYRVMLNSTLVSCGEYCILYIRSAELIKGVLLKCGRYTKAVGFQKQCTDIELSVQEIIKLVFKTCTYGINLVSTNMYTKDLTLLEEGKWERGDTN